MMALRNFFILSVSLIGSVRASQKSLSRKSATAFSRQEHSSRTVSRSLGTLGLKMSHSTLGTDDLSANNKGQLIDVGSLKKRLDEMDENYKEMKQTDKEMKQFMVVRQLAEDTDQKAMHFIFPGCYKKPYCLRSYKNLLSFVSNPNSDKYTGPFAPEAWAALSPTVKSGIQNRMKFIKDHYLYLAIYTEDLKNEDLYFRKGTNIDDVAILEEAVNGSNAFLLADLSSGFHFVTPLL